MITQLILIFLFHWIADFLYQKESWAISKSKNFHNLVKHVSLYSIIMTVAWYFITNTGLVNALLFGYITFVSHLITDYYTSKLNSYLYESKNFGSPVNIKIFNKKIPIIFNFGFFSSIGFDQLLHTIQLLLCYSLLNI